MKTATTDRMPTLDEIERELGTIGLILIADHFAKLLYGAYVLIGRYYASNHTTRRKIAMTILTIAFAAISNLAAFAMFAITFRWIVDLLVEFINAIHDRLALLFTAGVADIAVGLPLAIAITAAFIGCRRLARNGCWFTLMVAHKLTDPTWRRANHPIRPIAQPFYPTDFTA